MGLNLRKGFLGGLGLFLGLWVLGCQAPVMRSGQENLTLGLTLVISGVTAAPTAVEQAPGDPRPRLILPNAQTLEIRLEPQGGSGVLSFGPYTLTPAQTTLTIQLEDIPEGVYTVTADAKEAETTVFTQRTTGVSIRSNFQNLALNLVPANPGTLPSLSSLALDFTGLAAQKSRTWRLPASAPILGAGTIFIQGLGAGTTGFLQTLDGKMISQGSGPNMTLSTQGLAANQDALLTVHNGTTSACNGTVFTGPQMVPIPAGVEPSTNFPVGAFFMGATEVTQNQFQVIMGFNYSEAGQQGGQIPVGDVTMYDAMEFCNRLSDREGLDRVYTLNNVGTTPGAYNLSLSSGTYTADFSKNGYRLPTKSERIWAARGGSTTTYAWGPSETGAGDYEWYSVNSGGKYKDVAQKLPNGYGLYDMAGNMYEWSWGSDDPDNAIPARCAGTIGTGLYYLDPTITQNQNANDGGARGFFDNGFRVARGAWPKVTLNFLAPGATSGTPPASISAVKGQVVQLPGNTGNLIGALIQDGIRQRCYAWGGTTVGGLEYSFGANWTVTGDKTFYARFTQDTSVIGKIGPSGGWIFYDKGTKDTTPSWQSPAWRYLEAAPRVEGETEFWEYFNYNGGARDLDLEMDVWNLLSPANKAGIGWGLETTIYYVTASFQNTYYPMDPQRQFTSGSSPVRFYNLNYEGYTDWFLPSQEELQAMYTNLHTQGLGNLQGSKNYWCTTWGNDMVTKGKVFFGDGSFGTMHNTNGAFVRAVRRF